MNLRYFEVKMSRVCMLVLLLMLKGEQIKYFTYNYVYISEFDL